MFKNKRYENLKKEITSEIQSYLYRRAIEATSITITDFDLDCDEVFWVLFEYEHLGHINEEEIALSLSLEKFAKLFTFKIV